jgi:hypothetical protein
MAEFGMVRSFDIDDGQLDGLRPQEIFVLGYELALVDEALKTGGAFEKLIHAENWGRIKMECSRQGRQCRLTWMAGDVSESWAVLKVDSGP